MLYNAKEKILAISDTQAPFAHQDAIEFLKALKKKVKPTRVVHQGDEVDFHALGKWATDPDGYSPGHELTKAVEWMHGLYTLFPEVDVCISNHTMRPLLKAFNAGIPKKFLKDYSEFLDAPPGWRWAQRIEIDGVLFEHGEGVSGRDAAVKAAIQNRQCTSIAHLHSNAGVIYVASHRDMIWGLNTGCLIDADAYAFAYGIKLRNKPTLGCGFIDRGVPLFVPMLLNKDKRWVGELRGI